MVKRTPRGGSVDPHVELRPTLVRPSELDPSFVASQILYFKNLMQAVAASFPEIAAASMRVEVLQVQSPAKNSPATRGSVWSRSDMCPASLPVNISVWYVLSIATYVFSSFNMMERTSSGSRDNGKK